MSNQPEGLTIRDHGGDFELPPQDTHLAQCVHVIDLGTQIKNYQGHDKQVHELIITWELPEALMSDERPFVQTKFYTASLNAKANLRKDLEAWRGKQFADEEIKNGFSLKNVLAQWCLLGIVHKEFNNRTYANVASITKPPKTMIPSKPKTFNDFIYFDFANFNYDEFMKCPDWIKDKINKSFEMQAREGMPTNGESNTDEELDERNPPSVEKLPF